MVYVEDVFAQKDHIICINLKKDKGLQVDCTKNIQDDQLIQQSTV
jgi:hypothetical protein